MKVIDKQYHQRKWISLRVGEIEVVRSCENGKLPPQFGPATAPRPELNEERSGIYDIRVIITSIALIIYI